MQADEELIAALKVDDVERVRERLRRDPALLDATGPQGESLVALAAYAGATRVLALLRETIGEASVADAVLLDDESLLRRALARGADGVNRLTGDGWTPLHLAAYFGRPALAALLLDAGADLRARSTNAMANTPLHAALAGRPAPGLPALLLERGAPPDAVGGGGVRPLHLAASRGDTETAGLLLARGADVRATTDDGRTPAALAMERGHPALAERLRRVADGGRW